MASESSPAAVRVQISRSPGSADLPLPRYQTSGSAGMDLYAAVTGDLILAPGQRELVPTGIAIALPPGYEAQVRPRSGLALREGITCLNSPGTIDSDYRGEIKVILINLGQQPVSIKRGDRIAQMIIARCERAVWAEVETLAATERQAGGFGHTGRSG